MECSLIWNRLLVQINLLLTVNPTLYIETALRFNARLNSLMGSTELGT